MARDRPFIREAGIAHFINFKLERFEIYNSSKATEKIEEQGKTLDFPDLSPRVATALYSRRQPIKTAYEQMRISERVELGR